MTISLNIYPNLKIGESSLTGKTLRCGRREQGSSPGFTHGFPQLSHCPVV